MKRHFVLILVAILVLAGLTATAQIQRGSKKQEAKPKTEQPQKKQTPPKTNQGQAKKQSAAKQQVNGNSSSKKGNTSYTPKVERFTANGVTFEMVYVEGGTFTMGATDEQGSDAYGSEKPAHKVTLNSYYIGKYEVTQELWQAVMGSNPSYFKGDARRPVETVSWDDCQDFIRKLSQMTGKHFRLPTEAEWEYAARGGKWSRGYKYAGGNQLDAVVWYYNNAAGTTHPVGQKSPNELSLYDMSGNVLEWCQDWYGRYSSEHKTNPQGPSGSFCVIRGGCWFFNAELCRVSYRYYFKPSYQFNVLGLRLAL